MGKDYAFVKVGIKNRISIPISMVIELKIKQGDYIRVDKEEERIIITKVSV